MTVRIGMVRAANESFACLLDPEGILRHAPSQVSAWSGEYLDPSFLRSLTTAVSSNPDKFEPFPSDNFEFDLPVRGTRSLVCVGQNYRSHADELGMVSGPLPEPLVYLKPTYTLSEYGADVPVPENCRALSWEGELGVVLGSDAHLLRDVSEAGKCIAGYLVSNDIGDYDWTLNRGGQYVKGKSFAKFNPVGSWLSTCSWAALRRGNSVLKTTVNGRTVQCESLSNMIHTPEYIVWHVSQFMHLAPADIINCGTPGGTAAQSGNFLTVGDSVVVEIGGIGQSYVTFSMPVSYTRR